MYSGTPGSSSKSKGSGKLYRNLAPVFSIDDDQEGGNVEHE